MGIIISRLVARLQIYFHKQSTRSGVEFHNLNNVQVLLLASFVRKIWLFRICSGFFFMVFFCLGEIAIYWNFCLMNPFEELSITFSSNAIHFTILFDYQLLENLFLSRKTWLLCALCSNACPTRSTLIHFYTWLKIDCNSLVEQFYVRLVTHSFCFFFFFCFLWPFVFHIIWAWI